MAARRPATWADIPEMIPPPLGCNYKSLSKWLRRQRKRRAAW